MLKMEKDLALTLVFFLTNCLETGEQDICFNNLNNTDDEIQCTYSA